MTSPASVGGAALAIGLAVAWMLPPATPIGGVSVTQRSDGSRHVGTDKTLKAQPPSYDEAAYLPPDLPVTRNYPILANGEARGGDGRWPADGEVLRGAAFEQRALENAETQQAADADTAYAENRPDPGFSAGYRWAEKRQVQDMRECNLWAGTPREEGCRAFARDTQGRSNGEKSENDGAGAEL
ncbi:MAG TPA: hypothetical protein VNT42_00960 [Sphingomonas sp.]|nr:hypothetical protein [Sphingomonas sp.]